MTKFRLLALLLLPLLLSGCGPSAMNVADPYGSGGSGQYPMASPSSGVQMTNSLNPGTPGRY